MAWQKTEWACEHDGAMQLYGKHSGRDAAVAREAGRKCMACWLVEQWEKENDPRSKREDRYKLAAQIAEGRGKRINVPDSVPVKIIDEDKIKRIKYLEKVLGLKPMEDHLYYYLKQDDYLAYLESNVIKMKASY